MMTVVTTALVVLATVQAASPKAPVTPNAADVKAAGGTLPRLTRSPPDPDKRALFARGIQGEVVVSFVIDADGNSHDGQVVSSSRSPELDAMALDLMRRSTFAPARDRTGAPMSVRARLPLHFWKDSLVDGTMDRKTCADFITDADWHAANWPEQPANQVRSWLLIRGVATMLAVRGKVNPAATGASYDVVYQRCRREPAKRLWDAFLPS